MVPCTAILIAEASDNPFSNTGDHTCELLCKEDGLSADTIVQSQKENSTGFQGELVSSVKANKRVLLY